MKITWLGHSCFKIESDGGKVVVTDPFDESVNYPPPRIRADVVVVSHDHHDHNNVKALKGDPAVVRGPGKKTAEGIEFEGIASYHDEREGKLRGKNTIFCFEMDEIRVCHLGDLGHQLGEKEAAALGDVDVLMIPVGGTFTLDGEGAKKVAGQIKPRIVIPMHFKTAAVPPSFGIYPADDFLSGEKVNRPGHTLFVSKEALPKEGEGPRVMVLDYK
ncbi:MAG: MBL fold metallo-hydrolase [Methanothrix sp.]|uniref:Zn-dependent hydrolase of the beta-lactamase fold family n=1 Tax=Methanothrix harundinacea TaxID=301375 RepID=A0A101FUZ2_9EURY|nr:MAG: Zn-dependent hydrolase of the beta-lactamase fold family [Methanothrix harundinacea]MDD2638600.1 MBL fold metallo-hydrolase [Methanothrix sp.]MDI9399459.1 MBL fold metallo-hydrolase [Euryarchaeota archaeon]MCP1392934.1 MBL fold metallo-hydrolase [Methanothrix harundinacea]MDD3709487.1 MBL fold metallo-hydrolase [Methanothrix sp.]